MNSEIFDLKWSWAWFAGMILTCAACDSRRDEVWNLCDMLTQCQTGSGQMQSDIGKKFNTSCRTAITESLTTGQLTDAKMLECKSCLNTFERTGGLCGAVYDGHKCDTACDGIGWITTPKSSYRDIHGICEKVISACDSTPASSTALVPDASVERATAACADASVLEDEMSEQALAESCADSLTEQCVAELQGYVWGRLLVEDALRDAAETHCTVATSDDSEALQTGSFSKDSIAADPISAQTLRECQNCLLSQNGSATQCGNYASACGTACVGIPFVGNELRNTPASYLCSAAYQSCSQFVTPAPASFGDCVALLQASKTLQTDNAAEGASVSMANCARCVRMTQPASNSPCELLLAGACDFVCGCQLMTLLYEESAAHKFCTTATCVGTVRPESCIVETSSSGLDFSECLACLQTGRPDCYSPAQTGSDPGACVALCKAASGQ